MSEISRHLRLIYEKTFQRLICKINIQKTFIWRRNLRQTIKIEKTTTYVYIMEYWFMYTTGLCFSSTRLFLCYSRPYWCFISFSSSERFLYHSRAYWCFYIHFVFRKIWVPFVSQFLKLFFCFFDTTLLIFLYRIKCI